MEKEIKELGSKLDRVLFVLVDDPEIGHTGLGTDVKNLKSNIQDVKGNVERNTEEIKTIKKDIKGRDLTNFLKGAAVGGGSVGGSVKYASVIKAFFASIFG